MEPIMLSVAIVSAIVSFGTGIGAVLAQAQTKRAVGQKDDISIDITVDGKTVSVSPTTAEKVRTAINEESCPA